MRMRFSAVLALMLCACGGEQQDYYQGYAEGDFVRVAAPFAGRLVKLSTQRGDRVKAGEPLYVLEQESEAADRREAEERLESAQAQLANQTKARRAPELAMIQAEIRQAEASVKVSELLFRRRQALVDANAISKQELDEARASYERDRARVAELRAQLTNAKLPVARPDEIRAAEAEVAAAKAGFAQAEWRLAQKSVSAPRLGESTIPFSSRVSGLPRVRPWFRFCPLKTSTCASLFQSLRWARSMSAIR